MAICLQVCRGTPPELPGGVANDLRSVIKGLLWKEPEARMTLDIVLKFCSSGNWEDTGERASQTHDDELWPFVKSHVIVGNSAQDLLAGDSVLYHSDFQWHVGKIAGPNDFEEVLERLEEEDATEASKVEGKRHLATGRSVSL